MRMRRFPPQKEVGVVLSNTRFHHRVLWKVAVQHAENYINMTMDFYGTWRGSWMIICKDRAGDRTAETFRSCSLRCFDNDSIENN